MYAHNWPVFEVWRDVWRQWRWLGGGLGPPVRDGLDWGQVESVMRMRRIAPRRRSAMLTALRAMQDAALDVINKQTAQRK